MLCLLLQFLIGLSQLFLLDLKLLFRFLQSQGLGLQFVVAFPQIGLPEAQHLRLFRRFGQKIGHSVPFLGRMNRNSDGFRHLFDKRQGPVVHGIEKAQFQHSQDLAFE